jgi:hypothetical protein
MMKKVFLFLVFSISIWGQSNYYSNALRNYPLPGNGTFTGGFGLNWIDGKLFYAFHLTPEISLDNWGAGLDLQFDFDQRGIFRKNDYSQFSDYLSIIRYIRYGQENDPLFVKVGALDYYTLGHGSIINNYMNSPTYDARKIGVVAKVDYGKFGLVSIYSNFLQAGLFGIRGYYRPFQFTSEANIPIIGGLEIGGTFATDFNDKAGIISGHYDSFRRMFIPTIDDGSMKIVGMDVGVPLFNAGLLGVSFYTDYSKIINFGSGIASGLKFDINAVGDIRGYAKLERRFNFGKYLPSYFNSLYEIQRFQLDTVSGNFTGKALTLETLNNPGNGYFMELGIDIARLFYISGSYQRLDKDPSSGIFHVESELNPEDGNLFVKAGYDKINVNGESDLFKLDNHSYLYAEYGYKLTPYITLSVLYNWTFAPVRDSDNNVINYVSQKRVEPRISVILPMEL